MIDLDYFMAHRTAGMLPHDRTFCARRATLHLDRLARDPHLQSYPQAVWKTVS